MMFRMLLVTCVALVLVSLIGLGLSAFQTRAQIENLEHRAEINWLLNCVQIKASGIKEPLCDAMETLRRPDGK